MNISDEGLSLIKDFEGLRTEAYLDSVLIPTIGYGHTKDVQLGDTCTEEQATEWLRNDVGSAEKCVNNSVKVGMTQGQFDALVSWVFNLGCGRLKSSSVLSKLNAGDDVGAAESMVKYDRAGGQVIAGLTRRREAEKALFLA